ncbi:uncharacterized protein [Spinacia oleracea]|uniref:PB1-like domain-containing protein n=1 Tax=Spinacia oleracea TaxID=3562 RepID=A0ABM3RV24_SPIOL|nr:uncharacterized protein LOC130466083 [Spinacia oleracea]XP_056699480.1 uncharacterized protein LOC110802631 [Spinacia oleracea]
MEPKPCIVVHHGGCWKSVHGGMGYEGGSTTIFNDLAEDLDASYLRKLVSNLGYTNLSKLHYLDPRKSIVDGIRFLGYDYGGEQTLRSTTIMNDNAQLPSQSTQNSVTSSNHSFIAPNGRNYIYSKALQDLANKNRGHYNRD